MAHKLTKSILLYIICIFIIISITCTITCNYLIIRYAKEKTFSVAAYIPENEAGLLLGTSPKLKNGKNNLYFDYRITATAELYRAGKIKYILISGDNHKRNYNEPEEMKKALVREGIPANVIYLDYAGLRTLDSIIRAKQIFGLSSFTVISQKFHNERAIYIAGRNGIHAIGFNAGDVDAASGFKTRLRELLARVKVFIDIATNKKPRHLGEKVRLSPVDSLSLANTMFKYTQN